MGSTELDEPAPRLERYGGAGTNDVYENIFYTQPHWQTVSNASCRFGYEVKAFRILSDEKEQNKKII